jgi:4'-phosphopantetheinyl transferase
MEREMLYDDPEEVLWGAPSLPMALSSGEIHIWGADLGEPGMSMAQYYRLLSQDERKRAERYHFDKDRHRFILRRGILRKILGTYTNTPPERLSFGYSQRGKPELVDRAGMDEIKFNLSFSNRLAVFAFARDLEVGIDIENVRCVPEMGDMSFRFFSAFENRALQVLPETRKKYAFFSLWTCKEAFVKATGDGMSFPLNEFCVSLGPSPAPQLTSVRGNPPASSRWSIFTFTPDIGYTAALAARSQTFQLAYWKWEEAFLDSRENSSG